MLKDGDLDITEDPSLFSDNPLFSELCMLHVSFLMQLNVVDSAL